MKYIIENGRNQIMINNGKETVKIEVETGRISLFYVFKVLVENGVEPCHAQNVYDDLINR